jgi:hypothetical protein
MNKDQWFDEYERLCAEREAGEIDGSDEDLADQASDAVADRIATRIDQARDRVKEGLS